MKTMLTIVFLTAITLVCIYNAIRTYLKQRSLRLSEVRMRTDFLVSVPNEYQWVNDFDVYNARLHVEFEFM